MDKPLNMLESLTEIGAIVDFLSRELKRPVILERADFSLAAYHSYHIQQFDLANQQTIFSKKCPQHIYDKFMENGIIQELQDNTDRFTVGPIEEIGLNARIVKTIRHQGFIQGYIWLQEYQQSLTEEELDFFESATEHLALTMYAAQKLKLDESDSADRLYQIALNHSYTSKVELQKIAQEEGIPFTRHLIVIAFAQETKDQLTAQVEGLRKLGLANTYVLTLHGQIVVLSGEQPTSAMIGNMLKALKEETSGHNIWVGISRSCLDLSELARGYQEAVSVLRIAELLGEQPVERREFAKLGVFKYIEPLSQFQQENGYRNPDLLILERKDTTSQTEFIKTIEQYLIHNCRVKATSEHLFIHPNTLSYRLKQIQELTSIRFDNFNLNCQLLIDLMVLKKTRREQLT